MGGWGSWVRSLGGWTRVNDEDSGGWRVDGARQGLRAFHASAGPRNAQQVTLIEHGTAFESNLMT